MKLFAGIVLSVLSISLLCAQNRSETSAEQEYLSSIEAVIVAELAADDRRESKQEALVYLKSAVEEGRVTTVVRQTLINLAGEGTLSESRTNGRVTNNYPDIRWQACDLLGQVPSVESKEALKKIAYVENEPKVAAAAVEALAKMEMGETYDTLDSIIWVQKRFAAINPTSSLADAVLNAYQQLAPSVKDPSFKSQMVQSIAEIATNYSYVKPVRDKAFALLKTLRS
jgi:hypothetical protein